LRRDEPMIDRSAPLLIGGRMDGLRVPGAIMLLGVLVLMSARSASAQATSPLALPDAASVAELEHHAAGEWRPNTVPPSVNYQLGAHGQAPGRLLSRCCSLKSLLIGAAVGAGIGGLVTRFTCDEGDCTSVYIRGMAVTGGIGGGIGALLQRNASSGPIPSRRFQVAGVVGSTRRGGIATLSF